MGAAALLLVFIGIHNAWDTVTYVMFERAKEQREDRERARREQRAAAAREMASAAESPIRAPAAEAPGPGAPPTREGEAPPPASPTSR